MVDVFVSYRREDSGCAKQVVDALSAAGVNAWWDQMIPPGANWDRTIETTISEASCVIVLWSKSAVASDNVRCEADFALEADVLIPAKIDDCELPLFHRMTQCVDLQTWNGDKNHQGFQSLYDRVKSKINDPRAKLGSWGFGIAPPKPQIWLRYNSAVNVVVSILRGEAIDNTERAKAAISEVKGLFNRVRRKDQWDWFIVWQRFGLPPLAQLRQIVTALETLRDDLKEANASVIDSSRLVALGTLVLMLRFLGKEHTMRWRHTRARRPVGFSADSLGCARKASRSASHRDRAPQPASLHCSSAVWPLAARKEPTERARDAEPVGWPMPNRMA